MKNIFKICAISVATILFSGCVLDPTPKAVDLSVYEEKMKDKKFTVSVKKGESLKEVIKKIQDSNSDYIVIDKIENDIKFDRDLNDITTEDLKQFLKVSMNKNIIFRKYSDKMITVEERVARNKKAYTIEGTYVIPDKEININEKFTYEEIFALLREEKINIHVDLYKNKDFSLDKFVPQFKGKLKDFIDFIATNERLFVIIENNGVKLKDVQTITYNLKLPKVDLAPAISSDGSSAVISIGSALDGGISDGTKIGTIDPLKSLEEQLTKMLPSDKVTFNINKTNGTLSITGDYESMLIADMIVEDFQSIYDTAIKIELHIYQVELSDGNAFGIDYEFLKNKLVGESINVGSSLTGALSLTQESSNTFGVSDKRGLVAAADGTNSYNKIQGVLFKTLNQFGKTAVVTKPTLETINNLPVSLDVVDSLDYVAKIERGSSTSSTNSGLGTSSSRVDVDIETVTTGYSVVLHPKIDGEYIQIALKNIASVLNSLIPYSYMDGKEENILYLKDVSAKQFNEIIKIKEGEIAIIGGYMSSKDSSMKNGLPYTQSKDSIFDFFTAAKQKEKKTFEIVLTISASIM